MKSMREEMIEVLRMITTDGLLHPHGLHLSEDSCNCVMGSIIARSRKLLRDQGLLDPGAVENAKVNDVSAAPWE